MSCFTLGWQTEVVTLFVWGSEVWPDHRDSTEVTNLLSTSIPNLLSRKRVKHLFLWRDDGACLTFLVSLVPICKHKDLVPSIRMDLIQDRGRRGSEEWSLGLPWEKGGRWFFMNCCWRSLWDEQAWRNNLANFAHFKFVYVVPKIRQLDTLSLKFRKEALAKDRIFSLVNV